VDRRIIDGAGNVLANLFARAASAGRRLQTGIVRTYALAFFLGVVAILCYLAVRF